MKGTYNQRKNKAIEKRKSERENEKQKRERVATPEEKTEAAAQLRAWRRYQTEGILRRLLSGNS
jgi:hypothetical protein